MLRTIQADHWHICVVPVCARGDAFRAASAPHRIEHSPGERVLGAREPDGVGGHQRQIEALRERDQSPIDELFARLVVIGQL